MPCPWALLCDLPSFNRLWLYALIFPARPYPGYQRLKTTAVTTHKNTGQTFDISSYFAKMFLKRKRWL
jgi:hypothetical protein